MRCHFIKSIAAVALAACLAPVPASSALPKVDLTVELRQVRDGQEDMADPPSSGGAYIVSTAPRAAEFATQQVRVRNGEKASLRINQSMPVQWVQKVEAQSASLSAASASASSHAGSVTQAVTWMEAGQSLTVTPQWPGGKQAAMVDIEVQSSAVNDRNGSDLPTTTSHQVSTTVSAPLRQWVTIATTGTSARPGSYSSTGSSEGKRHIQIRLMPN
jgi:hypothetical protein